MIQLIISGINGDTEVAKVTDSLANIHSVNQVMVTLGHDSRATIIITGSATDDELRAAIDRAGTFSLEEIEREGLEPHKANR